MWAVTRNYEVCYYGLTRLVIKYDQIHSVHVAYISHTIKCLK